MKSVLENGGLAQLWSSLPLKFCKNFFKNSSPVSRTNPPEQIFKKKFQKNYWFDVVIRLEKSPKIGHFCLKKIKNISSIRWAELTSSAQDISDQVQLNLGKFFIGQAQLNENFANLQLCYWILLPKNCHKTDNFWSILKKLIGISIEFESFRIKFIQ